jgi:hypothetical protein
MPMINLKEPSQPVAMFSVDGCVVTVAGVSVDCVKEQTDSKTIVEVKSKNGQASIGGEGAYLAVIEIPAKTYTSQPTGETDEQTGQPVSTLVADELDPNAISITLWPSTI